jgi:hypothetical protein
MPLAIFRQRRRPSCHAVFERVQLSPGLTDTTADAGLFAQPPTSLTHNLPERTDLIGFECGKLSRIRG